MTVFLFGRAGDLIYQLAALKMHHARTGEKAQVLLAPAEHINFTKAAADWVIPLLASQSAYVESVGFLQVGQKTKYSFSEWWFGGYREQHQNLAKGIIDSWADATHTDPDYSFIQTPWLTVDAPDNGKTLVNRTGRYEVEGIDWGALIADQPDLTFVGFEKERDKFCELVGREPATLPLIQTGDALEQARLVKGCQRLIGVQSSTLAMAHGLGKPVTVISHLDHPDCIFLRDNATYPNTTQELRDQWGI